MASYADLYGYNWKNSTHPLPPLMTPTTQAFTSLELCLYLLGFGLTSLLLLCFYRKGAGGGGGGRVNRAQRHGQRLQCWVDLTFFFFCFSIRALNLQQRQVPSFAVCQLNGVMIHFVATLQFSAITGFVWERYYRLRLIRDNSLTHIAGKNSVAPHWRIFQCKSRTSFLVPPPRNPNLLLHAHADVVAPGLLLHALLPVLTGSEYGHYAPKSNNGLCFATGGEGVLKHDMFALANMLYFSSCFSVVIFASFKSLKIIHVLLASSSTGSTTKTAVQTEKRATRFAISVTVLFLACWTMVAVYFISLPFGVRSSNWPPM